MIAVDQFEEVFAVRHEDRAAFVTRLLAADAIVVITVRADLYGRCAAWPELGANQVLVGAMRRDELRRAVELPAAAAGLRVERDLADALVDDVDGEPAALPLLSTALLELWERRDGQVLRIADYERTGGVRGAVARLAEGAYAALDADEQRVARGILLRLAEEGEERAVVRRRVPLTELDADRDPRVQAVLDRLGKRRLLTLSDGTVEVGHEALLHEWPRLRGWLDDDAEGRRLHRRLAAAAGNGTPAGATARSSTAVPAWPPRSNGPTPTPPSRTRSSAPSSRAASRRANARSGVCGRAWRSSDRCWPSPSWREGSPWRSGATRGLRRERPTRSAWVRPRSSTWKPIGRCCWRARARRSRTPRRPGATFSPHCSSARP